MANLADKSGDAYSNIVQGNGSNSLTFRMPGNVPLSVESVVATIDNGFGGDAAVTLTVADPSGEVIAEKPQAQTFPAGDDGTATFALRLDDDARTLSLPAMHGAYGGGIGPATSGVPLTLDFRTEFAVNDTRVFSVVNNGDGFPESIGLEQTGVYLVFASVDWTTTGFTGSVTAGVEDEAGFFQSGHVATPPLAPNLYTNTEVSLIFVYRSYHFANLIAAQSSGVDRTPGQGTLKIVKLS